MAELISLDAYHFALSAPKYENLLCNFCLRKYIENETLYRFEAKPYVVLLVGPDGRLCNTVYLRVIFRYFHILATFTSQNILYIFRTKYM